MSDIDLTLVPMQDMIEELFKRTGTCIIAYTRVVDMGPEIILADWNGPSYLTASGLCDELKDVIKAHGRTHNYPDPGNV